VHKTLKAFSLFQKMDSGATIGCCGDNCSVCPRGVASRSTDPNALRIVAEMWFRAGLRDRVVSVDEIRCDGCKSVRNCAHESIRSCAHRQCLDNCGQCDRYACSEIEAIFAKTAIHECEWKNRCEPNEFRLIFEAFGEKRRNLDMERQRRRG